MRINFRKRYFYIDIGVKIVSVAACAHGGLFRKVMELEEQCYLGQ